MTTTHHVSVGEPSAVPEARRTAVRCAESLRFDAHAASRVGLYATELATNLVKHAGGGDLLVQAAPGAGAVDLLALDRGPGIADPTDALRRGVSTSGSAGLGLPAIRGAALEFDLYTRPGGGTAVFARISRPGARPRPAGGTFRYAGINVPYPGELQSGDGWSARSCGDRLELLVVDGLGHGAAAAEASRVAIDGFDRLQDATPVRHVERLHDALRHTRGAAVLVAAADARARTLTHCGVGNITGVIVETAAARHLVSHNGIVGHEMRRVRELTSAWPAGALVVLHSDGLKTRWRPDEYPGLWSRHPAVIAGVLYRDLHRDRDDATVLVASADGAPAEGR
jgi:anti-sigma regulatory factor (Ser/Thr protein kinase)